MSLVVIGWLILGTVVAGISIPVVRRLNRGERSRVAHDIRLELPALERIDSMKRATASDQQRMLNIMSARRELPSYISEETVAQGTDAVATLIELTRKRAGRSVPARALSVSA